MQIDEELLERRFKQLLYIANSKSDGLEEVSFSNGYWYEQEGYKYDLWEKAQTLLKLDTWEENRADAKYIIKCVTDTFAFLSDKGDKQNLISNASIYNVLEAFHRKPEETADLFYRIFNSDDDEDTFSSLSKMITMGNKIHDPISVAAYIFFLKDKTRYVPVRRDGFQERLIKLNIRADFMKTCTWENYSVVLDLVRQIREFLSSRMDSEINLLDAQSFLWMLWMVDESTLEYEEEELEENETVVIVGQKEGKKKLYYSPRYERDSRNRAAAIKIHGYTCAVCGFNFQEFYGELGKDFIEVHHIVPLASRDEEVVVNPETDLVCLCENCHRMIHRKKHAITTVEELRALIRK